jgi:hypothetical protein
MTESLIKAVIYGAVAGAIAFILSIFKLGAISSGFWAPGTGIMVFIYFIIGSVVGLFIGAVILMVISSICKGSIDFESNVRVTAAVMVVMPISAFLSFTGHFSIYLGTIISLGVTILSLWLVYNALIETLKSKPETTKTVMYILIAVFVIFSLLGLSVR